MKERNYFEGWYFKHVSASGGNAFAVIPGISLSNDSHSFIQFIDGDNGKTGYFRYAKENFIYDPRKLDIKIGNSQFTASKILLDLENENFKISGEVRYSEIKHLPKTLLAPGIMGWYSFVPGMECNHGVVSVDHRLSGSINVNGVESIFTSGKGYIEKDWGESFPESWIWVQCNNFYSENISVMISVAKIPWRKSFFIGFISFIHLNDRTIVFASYNGSKVIRLKRSGNLSEIVIGKGGLVLSAVVTGQGTGFLKAPSEGKMSSVIKESIDSDIYIDLQKNGKTLYSGKGIRAGFEVTEEIFSYF